MNKKKYCLFSVSILLIFTPIKAIKAQDGILENISYLYLEKLIAAAKENYPRVKNHGSQIASAKAELSRTKMSWLDPFSFQYVSRSNNSGSNLVDVTTMDVITGYQFGFSINPGILLAKPSQIKNAKEQLKIAQHERDEYFLSLESEVKRRYFAYLQAEKSIRPLNQSVLEAQSSLDLIKIAYQKGEINLQEYNSASIIYNQAYINKLQAETNFLSAKSSLEELTVKKLEEIK